MSDVVQMSDIVQMFDIVQMLPGSHKTDVPLQQRIVECLNKHGFLHTLLFNHNIFIPFYGCQSVFRSACICTHNDVFKLSLRMYMYACQILLRCYFHNQKDMVMDPVIGLQVV